MYDCFETMHKSCSCDWLRHGCHLQYMNIFHDRLTKTMKHNKTIKYISERTSHKH